MSLSYTLPKGWMLLYFINQELLTIVRGLLLLRAFFFSPVIYNTLVFHDMVCVCLQTKLPAPHDYLVKFHVNFCAMSFHG